VVFNILLPLTKMPEKPGKTGEKPGKSAEKNSIQAA
jgi:hypothetical protein